MHNSYGIVSMANKCKHIVIYRKLIDARKKSKFCELQGQSLNKKVRRCGKIPANILMKLLDDCPVGEGSIYENLVMDTIALILAGIIDSTLVRQQVPIEGGFCDIEFPICTEVINEYPLWEKWCAQYQVISILVEVKNKQKKATYEDVSQLEGYLSGGQLGHLGILASRSGFTKGALSSISSYANKSVLILPISHKDLKLLLELSMQNSLKIMTFLRRRGNLLLRLK